MAVAELSKRARTAGPEEPRRVAVSHSPSRGKVRKSPPPPSEAAVMRQAVIEMRDALTVVGNMETLIQRTVAAEVARSADVEQLRKNLNAEFVAGKLAGDLVDEIAERVLERVLRDDKFVEKTASLAYRAVLEGTVQ